METNWFIVAMVLGAVCLLELLLLANAQKALAISNPPGSQKETIDAVRTSVKELLEVFLNKAGEVAQTTPTPLDNIAVDAGKAALGLLDPPKVTPAQADKALYSEPPKLPETDKEIKPDG